MKSLKNVETSIDDEKGGKVDYKYLINQCLKSTPKDGFNFDEMDKRFRIKDIVEKSNGSIKLEDADANHLKVVVEQMKWVALDENIYNFLKAVKEL